MFSFVVINKPAVTVYADPFPVKRSEKGMTVSTAADEGLYGNVCRVLGKEQDFLHIISSYGYAGYVKEEDVLPAEEQEMREWLDHVQAVDGNCVDILTAPTVHGALLKTLPRGALVRSVEPAEEGYTRIILADGSEGYIASNCLMEKRFGEELLSEEPSELIELQINAVSKREQETGGKTGFDFRDVLDRWYGRDTFSSENAACSTDLSYQEKEELFRRELVSTAKKYLGVQYRWGGRSSFGIDCSGLTHMSYLLCGVHIFRDAAIVKEYPLKRLDLAWKDHLFDLSNLDSGVLKAGDTIYFPGHVAMYLGDGLYIHSTGKAGDLGVVINSLRPDHPLYRQDLHRKLYAAAGLRL